MPSCFACGRTRNMTTKSEKITFHKFPIKRPIKEQWDQFILANHLNVKSINQYSIICSKHFDQTCFMNYKTKRLLLKNAVPSKIVTRVKYARSVYAEKVKHLNRPFLCSDGESESSFDEKQTPVKTSPTPSIGTPNDSRRLNIKQLSVSNNEDGTNKSGAMPSTPRNSNLINISEHDKPCTTLCSDSESKSSFDVMQTAVKTSPKPSIGTPKRSRRLSIKKLSVTNKVDGTNKSGAMPSTPRKSNLTNISEHDKPCTTFCSDSESKSSYDVKQTQVKIPKPSIGTPKRSRRLKTTKQVSVTNEVDGTNKSGAMPSTPRKSNLTNTSKHDESRTKPRNTMCSFVAATDPDPDDNPRLVFLKHGLRQLTGEVKLKNRKIMIHQEQSRRQLKKIESMKAIIDKLRKENQINDDTIKRVLYCDRSCACNNNTIKNNICSNICKHVQDVKVKRVKDKVVISKTEVSSPMKTDELCTTVPITQHLTSLSAESIAEKFQQFYKTFVLQAGTLNGKQLKKINASIDTALGVLYEGEKNSINVENRVPVNQSTKNQKCLKAPEEQRLNNKCTLQNTNQIVNDLRKNEKTPYIHSEFDHTYAK